MGTKTEQNTPPLDPPRVTADYGGRRKVFDRRRHQKPNENTERRSGKDRRSGFDRRSALKPGKNKSQEKRQDFPQKSTP